jgi:hypothetical protein
MVAGELDRLGTTRKQPQRVLRGMRLIPVTA